MGSIHASESVKRFGSVVRRWSRLRGEGTLVRLKRTQRGVNSTFLCHVTKLLIIPHWFPLRHISYRSGGLKNNVSKRWKEWKKWWWCLCCIRTEVIPMNRFTCSEEMMDCTSSAKCHVTRSANLAGHRLTNSWKHNKLISLDTKNDCGWNHHPSSST